MVEREACPGLPDPLPGLRKCAEADREVMERGTRAFVSYVRGYREHQVGVSWRTSIAALLVATPTMQQGHLRPGVRMHVAHACLTSPACSMLG
jgi:hypothetical protein